MPVDRAKGLRFSSRLGGKDSKEGRKFRTAAGAAVFSTLKKLGASTAGGSQNCQIGLHGVETLGLPGLETVSGALGEKRKG